MLSLRCSAFKDRTAVDGAYSGNALAPRMQLTKSCNIAPHLTIVYNSLQDSIAHVAYIADNVGFSGEEMMMPQTKRFKNLVLVCLRPGCHI